MEGAGAYTIVDGHKVTLDANDFVLTPNGTWHEHGVEATGTPCISLRPIVGEASALIRKSCIRTPEARLKIRSEATLPGR